MCSRKRNKSPGIKKGSIRGSESNIRIFEVSQTWDWISSPPINSSVTLDKSLTLSISPCKKMIIILK